MRKVIVTGGRNFTNQAVIYRVLNHLRPQFLLVGDCPTGADLITREWAEETETRHKVFVADWTKWGKSAGPRRNKAMVDCADPDTIVIAFPGAAGTNHCCNYAQFERKLTVLRVQR